MVQSPNGKIRTASDNDVQPTNFRSVPMISRKVAFAAVVALMSSGAFAQTAADNAVQRDANQQERIDQGLKSGQLTTQEAGTLEREQKRVDNMEARDMKDGKVTPAEAKQLRDAQAKASHDIYVDKHNARTGNPDSASSERLQSDVQRNAAQQERIEKGLQSGQLSENQAARMEHGQAKINRAEANSAASGGRVNAAEQRRIKRMENRQSRRIHKDRAEKKEPQNQ
jgi:hypothetical protein